MASSNVVQRQASESTYVSVSSVSSSNTTIVHAQPNIIVTRVNNEKEEVPAIITESSTSSHEEYEMPSNTRRITTKVERLAPRIVQHEEIEMKELSGTILKEYEFEEQVAVEYTGIREDVVEHIVAVPVTKEEVKEELVPMTVVEIEKPVTVQRIVEVEQIEIVEKLREVPTASGRQHKTYNYVPRKKIVPQEKKVYIERPVERIVEFDDITYHDREEVIETVEVPEFQDVVRIKEIKVPTVIEILKETMEECDEYTDIDVMIPVGIEAHTNIEYKVPTIVEKRVSKGYPVYVPRFVEVPTSAINLTKEQRAKSCQIIDQLKELEISNAIDGKIISACEIEKLGVAAKHHDTCIQGHLDTKDLKQSLMNKFAGDETYRSSNSVQDMNEGYYGNSNVLGQWNQIIYPVVDQGSLSQAKSTLVTSYET